MPLLLENFILVLDKGYKTSFALLMVLVLAEQLLLIEKSIQVQLILVAVLEVFYYIQNKCNQK